MNDVELKKELESLQKQVRDLHTALDESALNEIALIATLKQLVPDFYPKFELLRSAAEKQIAAEDRASLRPWLDKLN